MNMNKTSYEHPETEVLEVRIERAVLSGELTGRADVDYDDNVMEGL